MLLQQRAKLLDQGNKLKNEINEQRSKCGHVDVEDKAQVEFCNKWRDKLRDEYANYSNVVKDFKQDVIKKMKALVEDLQKKVARDKHAIRNLGLEKRAEDFEEWEKLSTEAQAEWERQTFSSLIDISVVAAKPAIGSIKSLSPEKAEQLVAELERAGVTDPFLQEAIRELGKLSKADKQTLIRVGNQLLYRAKDAKDKQLLAEETPGKVNAKLKAITSVLAVGLNDPKLKLLVADVNFCIASVYNNVAQRVSQEQIERLNELTEEQLRDLKKLFGLLEGHVRRLNEAKKALAMMPE